MRLLVAASDGVYVCDEHGGAECVHKGNGPYYGITWNDEHVFVFARNGYGLMQTTVEVFDHQLRHKKSKMLPEIVNVHQAHWQNGVLYATNTNRNRIELFDRNLECLGYIKWTEETYDYNHINSIWGKGDHIWLCEHNGGTYSKPEWKFQSKVRMFGASSPFGQKGKKVIGRGFGEVGFNELDSFELGRGIHNFYREGSVGYCCSSQEACLLTTDNRRCEFPGWHPRGLARGDGFFVVGLSPCLPRSHRNHVGDGALAILDDDLKLEREVALHSKKQINEVRLLDEPDRAHNREILSP